MKHALMLIALLLLAVPTFAEPKPLVPKPIQFAVGKSSGKVAGGVIRGDRDIYSLDARAGQKMTVTISSVENNAVFQVYAPGAKATRNDDGVVEVVGKMLPGADGDTMNWSGRLPANGAYLIEVGGARGNATYELTISIE
jgi:hypothetical protein